LSEAKLFFISLQKKEQRECAQFLEEKTASETLITTLLYAKTA
jgi:hypothetical protein